jgi:hypothetical protein
MASEIVLAKTAAGSLVPIDQAGADYLAKIKVGKAVTATVKRHNNPAFHRKFFALLNLGFDAWEPGELEYKGVLVAKNFDQFRRDITILAGYFDSAISFKGDVRLTAKSLNFNAMDQDEREALYSSVINVLLARVLTQYSRDDLDNVVEQLLAFS